MQSRAINCLPPLLCRDSKVATLHIEVTMADIESTETPPTNVEDNVVDDAEEEESKV